MVPMKPIDTSELIKKQEEFMNKSLVMAGKIQEIQDKALDAEGDKQLSIKNIYELEVSERLKRMMAGIVESKEPTGDKNITVNIVNYGSVKLGEDNQVIDVTPSSEDNPE